MSSRPCAHWGPNDLQWYPHCNDDDDDDDDKDEDDEDDDDDNKDEDDDDDDDDNKDEDDDDDDDDVWIEEIKETSTTILSPLPIPTSSLEINNRSIIPTPI